VYSSALCFVEWPEKAPQLFDDAAMHITVEPLSETVRRVTLLSAADFNRQQAASQS